MFFHENDSIARNFLTQKLSRSDDVLQHNIAEKPHGAGQCANCLIHLSDLKETRSVELAAKDAPVHLIGNIEEK